MYHVKDLIARADRDNTFYQVVQCLYAMIHDAKLTPEEMRQALFLASYKYEINNVRPILREPIERLPDEN